MCGIAGIINYRAPEDKRQLLHRMVGFLHHRGPDAAGFYQRGAAGLGHARLSIIDLSSGDQPIHNEDQTIWVVYNGEIFNYPELRENLQSRGHRFYTRTDTEVLVHLYEEFGTSMFEHLNGQFAFGIWDENKAELLLARDRVGIHPLFYHRANGRLIFASEIKALLADSRLPRRLDFETLCDIFVCWSNHGDRTALETIRQLPPAHYAVFTETEFEVRPYWDLPAPDSAADEMHLDEACREFQALLVDASRIRLRADVPVGAYLSGGIDSTYTSALVKKHFDNRLCTFSVAFADAAFDESDYQNEAIRALQTDHRSVRCTAGDIAGSFPDVVWHAEIPMIRTAPAPLFALSELVRASNYKVVLTGEGADEIFAGYNIFKEAQIRSFWSRAPKSRIRPRLLERLYPYIFSGANEKAKSYLKSFYRKGLNNTTSPVYSHLPRWQNTAQLHTFLAEPGAADVRTPADFIAQFSSSLPKNIESWPIVTRAQYIEMKLFLSNYLLSTQGDRMIMAHSVEGRYPFLDHRVIEFAFRLPIRFRLNGLTEKFILKRAARGIIPDRVVDRPKQPYRAPISSVFFGPQTPDYVDEMLSEATLRESGYFNPQRVSRIVQKSRKNPKGLTSERENMALVGILSTQLFHHRFIRDFPSQPAHMPTNITVDIDPKG